MNEMNEKEYITKTFRARKRDQENISYLAKAWKCSDSQAMRRCFEIERQRIQLKNEQVKKLEVTQVQVFCWRDYTRDKDLWACNFIVNDSWILQCDHAGAFRIPEEREQYWNNQEAQKEAYNVYTGDGIRDLLEIPYTPDAIDLKYGEILQICSGTKSIWEGLAQ